ncbi:Eco57I restriction-modification methylase domain-containing protein [Sporosarcina ureae]|uniref:Eco57I restriction-modification methylase domain-containing protein n=1 Tax=Sporosarcina ureae TaxID=1571 RepID=UPI000A17CDFF|nr:DNA methyltransferase [Sporosarcina ureae]ARK21872.1 hypothetical protein SporoP32a_10255 [Sporosarcina ureae]
MQNYIFNRKYIKENLARWNTANIDKFSEKHKIIKNWNYSLTQSNLTKTKEVSIQGDFLSQIFTEVLGYNGRIGKKIWNIQAEKTTEVDGTVADGSLGFYSDTISDTRVVIELKDARTDLDTKQKRSNSQSPVEQAFSYQYKHRNCKWVIVSNFKEIRLYNSSTMTEYEQFLIEDLAADEDEFIKFYHLLSFENLINRDGSSFVDELHAKNEIEELNISEAFYKEYKIARQRLYQHLVDENKEINEITLLEKTQKILDRFIFICFCEDNKLLPTNVFRQLVQTAKSSYEFSDQRIWSQLKGLFSSIDKGNQPMNINRFNGGLFKEDDVLDRLIIKDTIFYLFEKITDYDFDSELDVNLLGHIFEQSIADIEELKAEIRGEDFDKTKSKQKKEGVFYTPPFVTQFIVRRTIGEWFEQKRIDLGENELIELTEEDFRKQAEKNKNKRIKKKTNLEKHVDFYVRLQEAIREIKILDPACGSGAFLNAAFDYLHQVGTEVSSKIEELTRIPDLFALDKHILKYNLYGVDLNKESIEITKLSLWLKTANKRDPLTSLDENILCGNSVVNDSDYDANPFDWQSSFKDVFDNGGFDIVIGNPPYVRQELIVGIKKHLSKEFKETYHGRADLYVYFFEKAFQVLKPGGKMGYICSSKYTTTTYGYPLKSYLLENARIRYFMDFDDLDVFKGIIAYPSIFIADKEKGFKDHEIKYCHFEELDIALDSYFEKNWRPYQQSDMVPDTWNFLESNIYALNEKLLTKYDTLGNILGKPNAGIKTGRNPAYILSNQQAKELIEKDEVNKEIIKPYMNGKDVKPYQAAPKHSIIFPYVENKEKGELELVNIEDYPLVEQHLAQFKEKLEARAIIKDGLESGMKMWYEYQQMNKSFSFDKVYITYPDIANRSSFALTKGAVLDMTLFWIETKEPYRELAILNSSIFNFLFNLVSTDAKGGYKRFKNTFMTRIPYINVGTDQSLGRLVKDSMKHSILESRFQDSVLSFVTEKFGIQNVNEKMEKWFSIPSQEFVKELNKQKIKLSQNDEFYLFELFETKKAELNKIQEDGELLHSEINKEVVKLYGLTEEEKSFIVL